MIYEPSTLPDETRFSADVVIIGSGAGGAVAASKLSERGLDVLVLEEGVNVTRDMLDMNERVLLPKLYQVQGGQATDDMSVRILQGRCLGGSTTVNWMTCLRTPDHVLNEWVEEHGLEEFAPSKMQRFFEEVEKRLSVHRIKDDEHNPHNRIILEGAKKLGIHGEASFNNSIDCIGCGFCGLGCSYDAKQDMRLTYLKDALSHETRIFTSTRAEKIRYESKNEQVIIARVLGSEYGLSDKEIRVTAKRTVVAGSAIGTPLLLQRSKMGKSKALGKFFRIHPVTLAIAKYDRIIDPAYGIPQSSYSEEYHNLDGNGYGFWLEVPPVQPIMGAVNIPGFGEQRREILRNYRKLGVILVLVRDGADKKSTGQVKWKRNKPSISYKLSKTDKQHLLKGLENAIEFHFAVGAKEVYTLHNKFTKLTSIDQKQVIWKLKNGPNQLSLFSAHPMGTARMGVNPRTSVVNAEMEMHHYPGVYVMDGSTLPTALGVNPMITILSTVTNTLSRVGTLGL